MLSCRVRLRRVGSGADCMRPARVFCKSRFHKAAYLPALFIQAAPAFTGDNTPCTMSRQVVTDILREELGFEGIIITDAMNMGAITDGQLIIYYSKSFLSTVESHFPAIDSRFCKAEYGLPVNTSGA